MRIAKIEKVLISPGEWDLLEKMKAFAYFLSNDPALTDKDLSTEAKELYTIMVHLTNSKKIEVEKND